MTEAQRKEQVSEVDVKVALHRIVLEAEQRGTELLSKEQGKQEEVQMRAQMGGSGNRDMHPALDVPAEGGVLAMAEGGD